MLKFLSFWRIFAVGLVVWLSWFFRFEHANDSFYLDHWTWEVVDYYGNRISVIPLDKIKNIPTKDELMQEVRRSQQSQNESENK